MTKSAPKTNEEEDGDDKADDDESSGANRRVNFDANNMSGNPKNMFKSGDDIMVEDVQVSPGALTVAPRDDDHQIEEGEESNVKRPNLNLQFGNITGIPSALGMTGVVADE